MNDKKDYKGLLRTIIGSPGPFLFLVFGVGSIVWGINNYWTQGRINWGETQAKLTDIQLNDRLRNKEKEIFLKLTYNYTVVNKKYQSYSEVILVTDSQSDTKTKELKKTKDLVTIYYNEDNPTETTFDIQETKADKQILYVLIPSMIMMAGIGYWGLKIRYEYYFKTDI